jgi:membrane protein DedA with SNARE-associated domain
MHVFLHKVQRVALGTHPSFEKLRGKAPLLIFLAIAIALVVYVVFEILVEAVINEEPWTSGPLISGILHLGRNVIGTVSSWGYAGILSLMILEASSLPFPSEIILPFSGYLVSIDKLNLWVTIFVATTGAIIGSLVDYYIGLKGYQAITKYRLFGRSICSESQLKTAMDWFSRYGPFMVFVARLIPVFRTIISFPAGAVRMPLTKFIAYTVSGCLIWNILLIYVGYYLGSSWTEVADVAHYLVIVAIVAFIALAAYLIIRRRRRIAACELAKRT